MRLIQSLKGLVSLPGRQAGYEKYDNQINLAQNLA